MRTVEIEVYTIDELKPKAKERAIQRQREQNGESGIHVESVTERMYEILQAHGWIEKVSWGAEHDDVSVSWSLGHCQGDGACFYNSRSAWFSSLDLERVIAAAASKGEADDLWCRQLRSLIKDHYFRFRLVHSGHYSHEHSISHDIEHEAPAELTALADEKGNDLLEMARDVCREMRNAGYEMLEAYDEDESIIEDIKSNELEFHADGRVFHE